MKKLSLFVLVALSSTSSASETCESGLNLDDGQEELLSVIESANKAKDKLISCAKRSPTVPINLEQKIEDLLDEIAEIDQLSQRERDKFFNRGSVQSRRLKRYYSSSSNRNYISMVAFASTPKHSQPDRKKVEEAIKSTYLDFAKDFGCEPRLAPDTNIKPLGQEIKANSYERAYQTQARLLKRLKSGDLEKKHQILTSEPGKMFYGRQDGLYNCQKNYHVPNAYYHYTENMLAPCSKAFTHHFPNNEWKLSSTSLAAIQASEEFSDLQTCIKDRMTFSGDVKIDKIQVKASSSALNNTGMAALAFGKKGFEALSAARAKEAQDKILPLLLPGKKLDKIVHKDFKGPNGDGTSGPCPYYLDANGNEQTKKGFERNGFRRGELEDDKYVKVIVTFSSAKKDIQKKVEFIKADYYCQGIKLKCAE